MANKTIDNLQEFTSPLTNYDLFIMYDVNPPAQGDENYSDTANTKKVTLGQLTQKLSDTFGNPYENIQENLYHSIKLNDINGNQIGEDSFFNVAEGNGTKATGGKSHAEGDRTWATGANSHAEGCQAHATGTSSHAEGELTEATKDHSHAEGYRTHATGYQSHAEGNSTTASGGTAHAEGDSTVASGAYSHAQNMGTIAAGTYQTAIGKYNVKDQNDQYVFIIGNGGSNLSRHNAVAVDWEGAIFAPEINISNTANIDKLNITSSAVVPTVSDLADSSTKVASTAFVQNLISNKLSPINTKIGSASIDNNFISRFGANILKAITNTDDMELIVTNDENGSNPTYFSDLLISENSNKGYDPDKNKHIRWTYHRPPGNTTYKPKDAPAPNVTTWMALTLLGRFQIVRAVNNNGPTIYVRGVSQNMQTGVCTVGNWYTLNASLVS